MSKINKLNKLKKINKLKNKTHKKIQYGGQIDEAYINDVFEYLYNDIYVEKKELNNLTEKNFDKKKYIQQNILDYEFFNKDKLKDVILSSSSLENNTYNLAPQPPEAEALNIQIKSNEEQHVDFNLELYAEWVAKRFTIEPSHPHIRIIDTKYGSENFASQNHREFTDNSMGPNGIWNVLCYYKNENCNLYNCGLGIIYKSNDIKNGKNIFKRVALPVINGLTLKIRDCYFWHFTPKLEFNNKTKNKSTDIIKRTLIRSYHTIGFEDSNFCYYTEKLNKLPIYQFTQIRNHKTPPVRPRQLTLSKIINTKTLKHNK